MNAANPEAIEIKRSTPHEIEAAKTPNGGWTRATLNSWGVGWPPKKGWKRELERNQKGTLR
jgi:hypothetical protein